ncbi:MAG: hypothetical protein HN846_03740 [Candidatus Pacebacteria bacterium]|nr:hypothetical protein [Candidatus Paceibacterota bacterium]MBT3511877.1 hypothetical protein [Candidatus Paceibacterota bacterium]MBT4005364.1 hypothetical protein [Candidatus Paceibacterota bacterium]MBT4359269.1 hypothetical protein [Candidatus Paceibacterota bacterium]MBT4680896.1 hypothetical protein [Candidatus Paceibacterota bacterium]
MVKKTKITLAKMFGVLATISGVIAALLIIAGTIGVFMGEPSFLLGIKAVMAMYSPFNIGHYLIVVLMFTPSIIFTKAKQWLINSTESEFQKRAKKRGEYLVKNLNRNVLEDK